MGKIYTFDKKLLTDTPEIRIGDKIYPVDNRVKTVEKIKTEEKENSGVMDEIRRILTLLIGKNAVKELNLEELPLPAASELMKISVAAATGEDYETVDARFQE